MSSQLLKNTLFRIMFCNRVSCPKSVCLMNGSVLLKYLNIYVTVSEPRRHGYEYNFIVIVVLVIVTYTTLIVYMVGTNRDQLLN